MMCKTKEEYNPIYCDHKRKSGKLKGFSSFELLSQTNSNNWGRSISVCRECGSIKLFLKKVIDGRWQTFEEIFSIDFPDAVEAIVKNCNWMNNSVMGYSPFIKEGRSNNE